MEESHSTNTCLKCREIAKVFAKSVLYSNVSDTHGEAPCDVAACPFRPRLATLHNLRGELRPPNCPDVAACFYYENDLDDPQKLALEWALEPRRPLPEKGPKRYRLIPYTSRPVDLKDLL